MILDHLASRDAGAASRDVSFCGPERPRAEA
jgi:hypothetical protein